MVVTNTRDGGVTGDITTATSGWTKQMYVSTLIAGDNDVQLAIFTAAGSAAAPSLAVTTAAGGASARIVDYREAGGTPTWDTAANASGATSGSQSTLTPTNITTTANNSLALSIVANRINGATLTLSTPQSFTKEYTDAPSTLVETTGLADRLVATAGAVTFPTWSSSGTVAWAFDSAAIKP
jgi:hypothetical protein